MCSNRHFACGTKWLLTQKKNANHSLENWFDRNGNNLIQRGKSIWLTSLFWIQVFFTRFRVLYHILLLDQTAFRWIGFGIQCDGVTYWWFDAIRCGWRFFIVTRCTSWIANVEKGFIMCRWRNSLTIKIKPTETKETKKKNMRNMKRSFLGNVVVLVVCIFCSVVHVCARWHLVRKTIFLRIRFAA